MTNQHRIGSVGIQPAIGLVDQRVVGEHRTALQWQRLGKMHRLRLDVSYGFH